MDRQRRTKARKPDSGMQRLTVSSFASAATLLILGAAPAFARTPTIHDGNTQASASSTQTGSIRGTITDDTGTAISAATVALSREDLAGAEVLSRESGEFSFTNVP